MYDEYNVIMYDENNLIMYDEYNLIMYDVRMYADDSNLIYASNDPDDATLNNGLIPIA